MTLHASSDSSIIRVSFVIPVLNGANFIEGCLDSILKEMLDGDEIIVVDNGSTDSTVELVRDYTQVKLLRQPDVTIATLRNRGAATAGGDVFAFIDSDCLVCEGWRQAVVTVLDDSAIAATGSICDIPENATWVERAWWSFSKTADALVNYINTGNFVVRREAFETVSGFNELLATDEDWDIGNRLGRAGYELYHASAVRVIHLGNAKTVAVFWNKERWHAQSLVGENWLVNADRAMLMTVLFLVTTVIAVAGIPFIYDVTCVFALLLLFLSAPILTVIFRVLQYRKYRFFFPLIVLYVIFYLARTTTMVSGFFRKGRS